MGKTISQLGRARFKHLSFERTHAFLKLSKLNALALSDQHCREKAQVTFSAQVRVPESVLRTQWCLSLILLKKWLFLEED